MADTYTSGSGDWVSPGNGTVQIEYWGAGGGGGAGEDGSNAGGSGGGSGEYRKVNALSVTSGQTVAYSIGNAGAAGTYPNDDATNGGDTTIAGGTYVAKGGGRGRGQGNGNIVGAGGTGGTGGDVVTGGNAGSARSGNDGGAGGNAPNGGTGGIAGISTSTNGGAATAPGAGGGGGGKQRNGGVGAAGRATFTFTPGAPVSSEILRPNGGLDEFSGEPDWINIDEVMTYDAIFGHDSDYADYPAGTSAGSNARKYKVTAPTPGYTIVKATLYVWAFANYNTPGVAVSEIYAVRIKLSGTWYDLSISPQTLGDVLSWFVFELPGLHESSSSSDIGFEITIRELHGYVFQQANVNVAYLELQYAAASQSSGFFHWF